MRLFVYGAGPLTTCVSAQEVLGLGLLKGRTKMGMRTWLEGLGWVQLVAWD